MIPVIPKVELTTAKYTKLFTDVSPSIKLGIQTFFLTFNNETKLYDMFLSMFRYHEICDEDELVFLQCVNDTFNEYKEYYKELIDNYTKEYDYALGNKRIVTRNDVGHSESNDHASSSGTNTKKDYSLPNKVVDPNEENGYLTDKTINNNSGEVNNTTDHDNTYGSTVTTEYKNEFLDLKRKYLNQIRNVYHEFCSKFEDCFLHIY